MKEYFECVVKFEKTMENGMVKKVSEPYIVDALSFTEAEKRFLEYIEPFMSGEFEVKAVKRANYSEIVSATDEEADKWYKVKVAFITLDEKTGVEKKSTQNMLMQASDLRDAVKRFDKHMEGTLADYEISAVSETAIMDVYFYTAEEKQEFKEE